MNHTTSSFNQESTTPGPIPTSGEDAHEKLSIQNDLFALLGVKDGDPRYADCLLVANYIAQSNHQAVQKALEGLLKQEILL